MAKKRTKAQRAAAAKAAWALRKAKNPNAGKKVVAAKPTPLPKVDFGGAMLHDAGVPAAGNEAPSVQAIGYRGTPGVVTAVAVQEGADFFVVISTEGSTFRHRLSPSLIRKLGMDCLTLVG
jgi:hypothetical protein